MQSTTSVASTPRVDGAQPWHAAMDHTGGVKVSVPARLVGRGSEFGVMRAALDRACAGDPVALVVGGEAGIGKSAMIAALCEEATSRGVPVVGGAATGGMEHALPYGPMAAALRGLADQHPDPDHLFGAHRDVLAALVPGIGPRRPAASGQPHWTAGAERPYALDQGRLRLFSAVVDTFAQAATDGLVVVVEDLHWADGSTLDLVSYLLQASGERVLAVLSHRTDDVRASHPLRARLAEWERLPHVSRVDLGRLSDESLYRLLTAGGPQRVGDSLIRDAVERSAGNPFVAQQLLAAGRIGAQPAGLRDAVLARLAALSHAGQAAVRATAAGGTAVPHEMLEEVVASDGVPLGTGLREAVEAHLLEPAGDGYAFSHALSREVVHDDLLPGERRRLHARYLAALRERPDLALTRMAAELAHHATEAQDHSAALEAWIAAANEAVEAYAYTEGLGYLEEAIGLWPTVADAEVRSGTRLALLHKKAAHLAVENADPTRAIRHAEAALALLDPVADPETVALTYRSLAHARYAIHDPDAEKAHLEALAILPPDRPSAARARVLAYYAMFLLLQGRTDEATPWIEEAHALAAEHGRPSDRFLTDTALAIHHAHHGRFEDADALLRETMVAADAAGEYGRALHARANLVDVLASRGRFDEAIEVALAGVRTTGAPVRGHTVFVLLNAVECALTQGRLNEAEEWLARASGRLSEGTIRLHGNIQLASLRLLQGDVDGSQHAVHAVGKTLERGTLAAQYALPAVTVQARLAVEEGNATAALTVATTALDEYLEEAGIHRFAGELLALAARAARLLDDSPGRDWVRRRLSAIRADGRPRTRLFDAWAAVVDGELAGHDTPDAVAAWRDAHTLATDLPAAPLAWYAARHLGQALLATAQSDEAASIVLPALEAATAAGAEALATPLAGLADRGRLRPTATRGSSGLTPREVEVLALVAAGRTNRQIGEALFISPKTASVHVSNLLRKLGLSNRSEAAGYAHRHGLI